MKPSPIIAPSGLQPTFLLFDARSATAYAAGHLPGAQHADLDRDLAAPVIDPSQGGRHPLPDPEAWAARLTSWGVRPDSTS